MARRPDLQILMLRGNVNTRLAKLDAGEYDAIILAVAGLKRLGFANRIREHIDTLISLPAIGQGAVGIECRTHDERIIALIAPCGTFVRMAGMAQNIEHIRHTLAHLLAASVRDLYPGAKNAIGPAVDDGFYQDFDVPRPISDNELSKIEQRMREKLKKWQSFERREVTPEEAKKEFAWNEYKVELIEEFFKSVATNAKANLHITVPYGTNNHHIAEAIFKATAKALRQAVGHDPRNQDVPSTKGSL